MFEINIYSILNSIFLTCIMIFIYFLIQTISLHLNKKISIFFYYLLNLLIILRLLFPFELTSKTYIFQVGKIFPSIVRFLNYKLFLIKNETYNILITINVFILIISIFSIISIIKIVNLFYSYFKLFSRTKYIATTDEKKIINILETLKCKNNFNFEVKVIKSNIFEFPFEFGFFSQTICLPKKNYDDEEISFFLLHELFHFKNFSNWFKLLNNILICVFWWNPIIVFLNTFVTTTLELHCDDCTTRHFNNYMKAKYLNCLINKKQYNQSSQYMIKFSSSNSKQLYKRFKVITSTFRYSKFFNFYCICSILIIFILSYLFMFVPRCEILNKDIQVPTFTQDNSYIIKENNSFIIYYEDNPYIYLDSLNESFSDLKIIDKNNYKKEIPYE